MRLLSIAFLILLLATGCGTKKPTESIDREITLTLDQAVFEPDDTIILTITNGLDRPIYVGVCPGAVPEKKNDAAWEPVWLPLWTAPEVCPDVLPPKLEVGESMKVEFEVFKQSGVYRFALAVFEDAHARGGEIVHSQPFRVNRGPIQSN